MVSARRRAPRLAAVLVSGLVAAGVLMACVLTGAIFAERADAHQGGKAIPKVEISAAPDPSGPLTLAITARIRDADSDNPVQGANVTFEAVMAEPHEMWTLPTTMTETSEPGAYAATVRFPMAADWKFKVKVQGDSVQPATAETDYRITFQGAEGSGTASGAATRAQVQVKGSLGLGDLVPITSLVLHSLAAILWVGLTLLLVLAAGDMTGKRIGEDFREELLEKGSRWRAGAVAAGIVLVVTGICNTLIVAPFKIAPTPDAISNAIEIPFGGLYLAILGAKIVLMALLIVINRIPPKNVVQAARFALRADMVLLPLLLVAVVSLRYVHVLSHVAQSVA